MNRYEIRTEAHGHFASADDLDIAQAIADRLARNWYGTGKVVIQDNEAGLDGCVCPGPDTCMGPPCSSARRMVAT